MWVRDSKSRHIQKIELCCVPLHALPLSRGDVTCSSSLMCTHKVWCKHRIIDGFVLPRAFTSCREERQYKNKYKKMPTNKTMHKGKSQGPRFTDDECWSEMPPEIWKDKCQGTTDTIDSWGKEKHISMETAEKDSFLDLRRVKNHFVRSSTNFYGLMKKHNVIWGELPMWLSTEDLANQKSIKI